jgi:hypothetical protein
MIRPRIASVLLSLGLLIALSAGMASDALAAAPSQTAKAAKAKPKSAAGTRVAVLEVTGMT